MMFYFQSGQLGHSTNTIILKVTRNEHKSYAWVFGVICTFQSSQFFDRLSMHFGVVDHIRTSVPTPTTADRRPPSWNRITDSTLVRDSSVVRRHYILLLEPSNVRAQYIRKTADLLLQLRVSTFPRFVAIGIFFPEFNIRLYDKNCESDFFFPPPESEYFFQQHWESEYFFRKKP